MKRALACLLAAVAVLVGSAAVAVATAAAAAPQLAQARSERFPSRSWVLTLPERRDLRASDVEIRENNKPVQGLKVVPGDRAAMRSFGVVLAVDASNSMAGKAIEGAMAAARRFADTRKPNQALGLLLFNSRVEPALQPTTNGARIAQALAREPRLQQGTHIYDAGLAAIRMLQRARVKAGSVVVLSDGDDVGSRADGGRLSTAARKARVRIFTVGLASPDFQPATLRQIARDAGGQYSEATSNAQLSGIYARLGQQLASQYLVTYRSLAQLGSLVDVEVTVRGTSGVGTAQYPTPVLPGGLPAPQQGGLPGALGMLVVALVAAALLGLAVLLVVRRPKAPVRQRVSAYGMPTHGRLGVQTTRPSHTSLGALMERPLRRARWWPQLEQAVEIAGLPVTAGQLVALTVAATVVAGWLLAVAAHVAVAIALMPFLPIGVWVAVRAQLERRRRRFADELADNLQVVASAIRAGHSFAGGLALAAADAAEPARHEFERIVRDERLGIALKDSMAAVAERMDSRELEHVAVVVEIQREVGGNTAQVLDQVVESIRYRAELRRLVTSLTAQGRLGGMIVSSLPLVMALGLSIVSPGYLTPLLDSALGVVVIVISAAMIGVGWLIIRRIVDIKV